MTKFAIKNENITSFGGIYHVMDVFPFNGNSMVKDRVLTYVLFLPSLSYIQQNVPTYVLFAAFAELCNTHTEWYNTRATGSA